MFHPIILEIKLQCTKSDHAEAMLPRTVQKYEHSASQLADWLEANRPEELTVLAFPEAHRRFIRTTNGLERVRQEIRPRTRVVRIFPNEASCLWLICAVLMEISESWETRRKYLTFLRGNDYLTTSAMHSTTFTENMLLNICLNASPTFESKPNICDSCEY